ncbi:MAG: glycosyltransferase family 4 protein, partial [Turicibacter sp.]
MNSVKKMLQVGLPDSVLGSLMKEIFITLYPNFKLDLLLLDSDDVNEIPSGIYTHVYREKDEIRSDYDVTLVLDALDRREKLAGYELIDQLLKATSGYVLALTKDDMFSQDEQWSIVDFSHYDISYYGIQIDSLKKSLFKIYKTEFETPLKTDNLTNTVPYRVLKITCIMPHKNLTGGLKMLYEQMKHLQKRGHQIRVVLRGEFEKVVPEWVDNFIPDEEKVIGTGTKYLDVIKDSDIVFSGFINQLEELENNKIPVLYWEQGHETLYGDVSNRNNEKYNRELLAKLYGANVYLASDSEYVQKIIRAKFNKDSYVLPNFIDTTSYYPIENTEPKETLTILLVGNPILKFKGFEKALSVLVKLWNEGKRFKVVWACQIKPSISPLPFDIKFYENISQTELTQVYREADILLSCSMYEGCPMPPLEAMASGVAVVTTNCGGINQYAKHERNALISNKGNAEELASYVSLLLENYNLRHELIENGLITAQELNYENGAVILEEMLLRVTADYKNRISLRFPNEKIKILFMIGTLDGGGAEKVLTTIVQNLNPNVFDITVQTMYDTGIYIDKVKEHAKYITIYKTIAYSQEEAD